MEQYKISTLLNDSTVSKFVTKKWIEVSDLSSGQYSVKKNMLKDMDFYHLLENIKNNYWIQD